MANQDAGDGRAGRPLLVRTAVALLVVAAAAGVIWLLVAMPGMGHGGHSP